MLVGLHPIVAGGCLNIAAQRNPGPFCAFDRGRQINSLSLRILYLIPLPAMPQWQWFPHQDEILEKSCSADGYDAQRSAAIPHGASFRLLLCKSLLTWLPAPSGHATMCYYMWGTAKLPNIHIHAQARW